MSFKSLCETSRSDLPTVSSPARLGMFYLPCLTDIVAAMEPLVEMPSMASYGVNATGWNGLPWSWASERLVANRNYWVVTVSGAGEPHSMPVWGVWDTAQNVFGFSCAPDSKKRRNLAVNGHVSVSCSDTVECISVQGVARVLDPQDPQNTQSLDSIVALYVAKYSGEAPGDLGAFVRAHTIVEVRPTVAFGVVEREEDFATRATRWRFWELNDGR